MTHVYGVGQLLPISGNMVIVMYWQLDDTCWKIKSEHNCNPINNQIKVGENGSQASVCLITVGYFLPCDAFHSLDNFYLSQEKQSIHTNTICNLQAIFYDQIGRVYSIYMNEPRQPHENTS